MVYHFRLIVYKKMLQDQSERHSSKLQYVSEVPHKMGSTQTQQNSHLFTKIQVFYEKIKVFLT